MDVNYISEKDASEINKRSKVDKEDIILSMIGTIGNAALVLEEPTYCIKNVALLKPRKRNSTFVIQLIQSPLFQRSILESLDGGIQKFISLGTLRKLIIPLPPLPEQQAIAEALSDIDQLIASLDQLIEKRRALKTATMQQLLTGKTRLKGFSGDWEAFILGDLIKAIKDGATPNTNIAANFVGPIYWAVIEDIVDIIVSTKSTLSERGLQSCAATLWPVGTLILSTGATIGEVGIAKVPLATKQGICGLIFNSEMIETVYMKYWFQLNRPMLLARAQGSTIKEIRPPELIKLDIKLPRLKEQAAIAEVLSDMDAEITELEQRRDKTIAIKQGMMQELLTGKTRLI